LVFKQAIAGCATGLLLLTIGAVVAAPLDGLTDPMQPLAAPVAIPSTEASDAPPVVWQLQGIRIDTRRRSALINGQSVAVGEEVDGAKVLKIENDSVVIQSGDKPSTLRLLKHDVKHRSRARR
jgi:hypothetical protein